MTKEEGNLFVSLRSDTTYVICGNPVGLDVVVLSRVRL
jgi:hypothetical protein